MSIRTLYIGDVDAKLQRSPGDLLPGEDPRVTRVAPAPLPPTIAPGNGYGATRANGVRHWGIDIARHPDELVIAPEHGTIVDVWTDNTTQNFQGYGPGGVLLKGDSGVFHLLGHLDPSRWSQSSRPTVGEVFEVGEQVGHTAPTGTDGVGAAAPHVHWEVRVKPIDTPTTRPANTFDPRRWLVGGRGVQLISEAPPRGGGGSGWILLLVLFAMSRRR